MSKKLVIVESPAKAKTIVNYLGDDYVVKASFGHVRDLAKKNIGVDVEGDFTPTYTVMADKKSVISELKKEAKNADEVLLATDPDREGEAIAWHLSEALKLPVSTKRIVFNEITKTAIQEAIQHPRSIDSALVDAQQARRVLDRLVGFELSPVLWRKVKAGLSAGRVQSVAVKLIVEREREIEAFVPESFYKITAQFTTTENERIPAEISVKIKSKQDALAILNECVSAAFTVESVDQKPSQKSPSPPFTTSSLQQEASRKLSFSVSKTMSVAQQLYEAGHISYMRTDSVHLSKDAMANAASVITKKYGKDYSNPTQYSTKSKGAQEAHEAIRPTHFDKTEAGTTSDQKRLYALIWKRALASQMSKAQIEKTTIKIAGATHPFVAQGEVILFDGFLTLYLEGNDEDSEEETSGRLPKVWPGAQVSRGDVMAHERFTKHPPRYSEASLVKKLEELGIGRPSTYAPTISTIQKRNYIEKTDREGTSRAVTKLNLSGTAITESTADEITGREKAKLFPTDMGRLVTDFLSENFNDIMDYHFTAKVEQEFDDIAAGKMVWNAMIKQFYSGFHPVVESVQQTAQRVSGERVLGVDPKTGHEVVVRLAKYGPVAMMVNRENEDEKPRFASLQKHQTLDSITLEEALDLFKLPREVGEHNGKTITAAIGRFGPYLKIGTLFVSLKEDDPLTVPLDRAIALIQEKEEAEQNKYIHVFDEKKPVIQVLNGRFGPYITTGRKQNYKIPKGTDPASLTRVQCEEIIAAAKK